MTTHMLNRRDLLGTTAKGLAAFTAFSGGAVFAAGFADVTIVDSGADLNAYKEAASAACCGPASPEPGASACCGPDPVVEVDESADFHDKLSTLLETYDVNDYAASVKMFAVKPMGEGATAG